jgi:uncharacterized protein
VNTSSYGVSEWAWLAVASLIVGVSKTGIAGSGIISVVMFALLLPGRAATGALLPLLITADLIAVAMFRRQANWRELWRIFPATALGVVIGWALLDRIDDTTVKRLIGAIIVIVVLMQIAQRFKNGNRPLEAPRWFAGVVGATAGFATMIANAAGPIMTIYLLAMKLPKLEFVGTGAWFFLVINVFKVPFGINLGIINLKSLWFDAILAPFAVVGAFAGRWLLDRIDQSWFERAVIVFAFLGGIRLLF